MTEVHSIVQEVVIKTIPKRKKCKKAKWLPEDVLQIAEKREAKGKGEKERYPPECKIPKNSKDLTEAEKIKKRWQEYTELYKNGLNDPDNHDDVITHLYSEILEYKVK